MKNLPIYAKTLLLQGASTTGTFTEGYFFIEEKIQINHSKTLLDFCKWIDKNIGGASSYNIDMLFSAFKNPTNVELNKQANELAIKIRNIKSL
jgi:hypothetical protein